MALSKQQAEDNAQNPKQPQSSQAQTKKDTIITWHLPCSCLFSCFVYLSPFVLIVGEKKTEAEERKRRKKRQLQSRRLTRRGAGTSWPRRSWPRWSRLKRRRRRPRNTSAGQYKNKKVQRPRNILHLSSCYFLSFALLIQRGGAQGGSFRGGVGCGEDGQGEVAADKDVDKGSPKIDGEFT